MNRPTSAITVSPLTIVEESDGEMLFELDRFALDEGDEDDTKSDEELVLRAMFEPLGAHVVIDAPDEIDLEGSIEAISEIMRK